MKLTEQEKAVLCRLKSCYSYDFLNEDFLDCEKLRKVLPKYYYYFDKTMHRIYKPTVKKAVVKILKWLVDKRLVNRKVMWLHQREIWEYTQARHCNSYIISDTWNRILEKYPNLLD